MDMYCRDSNLPYYIDNEKTLLIIDEIQLNSRVYNAISKLHKNLNCDLIVIGNYLGQILKKKEFFQLEVTVSNLKMYPLSFREFCRVFKNQDLYGIYREIGGYPNVVKMYKHHQDIKKCRVVIEDLLKNFEKDSRNYFQEIEETLIFNTIYIQVIQEMNLNKRGSRTKLIETVTSLVNESKTMRVSRDGVSRAIQWMIYSDILGECSLYNNKTPSSRLHYIDCGIASYIVSQMYISQSNIDELITETFVYSELNRSLSLISNYE